MCISIWTRIPLLGPAFQLHSHLYVISLRANEGKREMALEYFLRMRAKEREREGE